MIIGSAITEDIVRQDPRYVDRETISLSEISAYTVEQQSVSSTDAKIMLDTIKAEYGTAISVLVRIYNASGEPLDLQTPHDWHGHFWRYPADGRIENGQWSVFLHVYHTFGFAGSAGAVVYRATHANQDILLGWANPYIGENSVYVESRETGHWGGKHMFDYIYDHKLTADDAGSGATDTWGSLRVTGRIGQNTSPVVEFVISHP